MPRFPHAPPGDTRQEVRIATPYDRPIDRALRTHKRLSRAVTGVILLAGLLVLALVALSSGWRR
ncbi:MAG TPA: hypothetical protein VHG08_10000, partial [Longimicrobium sp.]|nr:hypothetical protein [Longimicrobium sp.]